MSLDNSTRKEFRSIGHKLHPIVIVKGLSNGTRTELERALSDHELIKIRVLATDREEKQALIGTICEEFGAEAVQVTGHVVLLYRANPRAQPALSNLQRHRLTR